MLSEKLIDRLYSKLKAKAKKAVENGRHDLALKYLMAASYEAYYFNRGFVDEDIEQLLAKISKKIKRTPVGEPDENTCVFVNSFNFKDGLVIHYVNALSSLGKQIIYISDSEKITDPVLLEALDKPNIREIQVPERLEGLDRAQYIHDAIAKAKPAYLFTHIKPWSVEAIAAFEALPEGITKYQINITDHTFWAGRDFADYILEFRDYGAYISENLRHIPAEKIRLLPFYSVNVKKEFGDFPEFCKGKTVILSGGNFYKILDKDNTFVDIVKGILDRNDEAVVLFAGDGDKSVFETLLDNPKYSNRFGLLGYRLDIDEIIKHCDIYLNTYPYGGGLMCQYAAKHAKPILSLHTEGLSKAEDFICQLGTNKVSSHTTDELLAEAKKLVTDKGYRKEVGAKNKACIMDEDKFSDRLNGILKGEAYTWRKDRTSPNQLNTKSKIEYEKKHHEFTRMYFSKLRLHGAIISPGYAIYYMTKVLPSVLKSKIRKRS